LEVLEVGEVILTLTLAAAEARSFSAEDAAEGKGMAVRGLMLLGRLGVDWRGDNA